MAFTKQNLIGLIKLAVSHSASDVHLRTNEGPCLRIKGELIPVQAKNFSADDIVDVIKIILPKDRDIKNLEDINEMDGGFTIEGLCRARYNLFRYQAGLGVILRIITEKIPTIKSLGLPSILNSISSQQRGLVLVTGPTGSGKSTTLAAMLDHINTNRNAHIITIEDPVEYLHSQKKSRITQREIGADTQSFANALRSALRQDPDVILIGEMRDPETVQIALKASETGHIVFSTVHTTNALSTIGRIISMFPPEEQADVRKRLANNLYSTIGQRMLKRSDEKGVAIATEIMISTPGIKECIIGEEPLQRINDIIQENHKAGGNGSQSFDQNIMHLYEEGIISKETALSAASSQSDFIQKIDFD